MRIIYNKSMKKILLISKCTNNIIDINLNIDNLISDDLDFSDDYILSLRIDEYFCWNKMSKIEYVDISFLILWKYLKELEVLFPEENFIWTIQYDKWDEDVVEGFFVKYFTTKQYYNYFNWEDILKINIPYIKVIN